MQTYVVHAVGTSLVKIGRGKNARNRIASLKTACPHELATVIVLEGDQEAQLHERFRSYRETGEWFCADGELRVWVRRDCQYLGLPPSKKDPGNKAIKRDPCSELEIAEWLSEWSNWRFWWGKDCEDAWEAIFEEFWEHPATKGLGCKDEDESTIPDDFVMGVVWFLEAFQSTRLGLGIGKCRENDPWIPLVLILREPAKHERGRCVDTILRLYEDCEDDYICDVFRLLTAFIRADGTKVLLDWQDVPSPYNMPGYGWQLKPPSEQTTPLSEHPELAVDFEFRRPAVVPEGPVTCAT